MEKNSFHNSINGLGALKTPHGYLIFGELCLTPMINVNNHCACLSMVNKVYFQRRNKIL